VRRTTSVAALLAGLVLAAAGCGGSDDEATSTEAWAAGLCTSISTWTTALGEAGTALSDPSSLSVDGFKSTIEGAIDATGTFGDDLRGLGRPDTEAGSTASDELNQLADQLDDQRDELSATIDEDADTISDLLGKLSSITSTLTSMANEVGQTFDNLSNLDGAAELESAFEDAESCQQLGSTR
jgi:methyl-accepting chemotaxis protein